ncbi:MAG: TatD DNase family protein [Parcubacteria group bacterium Greene0714_2]|nr:MAG: TatD DNase family protein [Parcubacteria group bacterium Greene0714_2]
MSLVLVGTQANTSQLAIDGAEKYERVYATVGIHPIHLLDRMVTEEEDSFHTKAEVFDRALYSRMIESSAKVVAIGEVGLDYYWIKELSQDDQLAKKDQQKQVFIQFYELAKSYKLPLVIHCRDAYADLLMLLEELVADEPARTRGVIHSFCGNYRQAIRFRELGFYIGLNGIITYSESYNKVITNVGLDGLVLETDCPYLTPNPLDRKSRNEPRNVSYVAEKIGKVLGVSLEAVIEKTDGNAKKLFGV